MSSNNLVTDPKERVRQLSKIATDLAEIDFAIPLMRYFRAAKEVVRTAQYYESENCLENAFVLYSKYITLFVEKFPHHPQYKKIDSKEKQAYYKGLQDVFTKAENVKQQLVKAYSLEDKEIGMAKLLEGEGIQENISKCKKDATENEELLELERRFKRIKNQDQLGFTTQKTFSNLDDFTKDKPADNGINNISNPPPAYASVICDATYSSVKDFNLPSQITIRPQFDRSLKPQFLDTQEDGLKTIHIPNNLAPEFMDRAQSNTDKNIETCAILCGKLQQKNWHITHILIPNQSGKSDSCDIENDEEVVEFQDQHDLVTLGWIHTHPSQTAFLSSVDQHTHWPYQKLLPEAISIVCAPKFKEVGYFHLTPKFGMEFVQKCKGKGFHEHPIKPAIFQSAPHILLGQFTSILVEDLRKNRK